MFQVTRSRQPRSSAAGRRPRPSIKLFRDGRFSFGSAVAALMADGQHGHTAGVSLQMNHFLPISIFSIFFRNPKSWKLLFFVHHVVTQLPSEPVSIFRLC